MKTVAQMKQDRAKFLTEAEGILDAAEEGERSLSPEEQSRYDVIVASVEQMNKDIEARMRLEAAAAPTFEADPVTRATPSNTLDNTPVQSSTVIETDGGQRVESIRSYGKLVAFDKTPDGNMKAYRAGQWLNATLYGNVYSQEWCRKNGVGVRSALAGGINTSGGALVPEELERAIIDLREEYGLFRRACRVTPMSSDTRSVPRRTGGLTANFVGENVAGSESDAAWDNVMLVAKKLMVLTRMSSEVSEDAIIDLADVMAQEVAYAFAVKEDNVGFNGTGISSDGGIVGVWTKALQAAHTKAKVTGAAGHNTLAEIDSDDLLSVMAAIPTYAKAGSAWYCSPTAMELVFNAIKIAGGGNTRDMLADSDTPRFLGYPINVTPVMSDDAAADYDGVVVVGFGNLRQAATMGDRRGIRIALSNEQYWEEDQIGVKGTERFDINAHDMGSTTDKSPLVALVGGSA